MDSQRSKCSALHVNCAIVGEHVGTPGRERETQAALESSMWKPLELSLQSLGEMEDESDNRKVFLVKEWEEDGRACVTHSFTHSLAHSLNQSVSKELLFLKREIKGNF